MIIPVHYLDELSRPAIVKIEGICYVRKMIKNHDMISTALQSSLVQGIIMDPWIVSYCCLRFVSSFSSNSKFNANIYFI